MPPWDAALSTGPSSQCFGISLPTISKDKRTQALSIHTQTYKHACTDSGTSLATFSLLSPHKNTDERARGLLSFIEAAYLGGDLDTYKHDNDFSKGAGRGSHCRY